MKLNNTCMNVITKIQAMLISGYNDTGFNNNDVWSILNSKGDLYWNKVKINANKIRNENDLENVLKKLFEDFDNSKQIEFENIIINLEVNKDADTKFISSILEIINQKISDKSNLIFNTTVNNNFNIFDIEVSLLGRTYKQVSE